MTDVDPPFSGSDSLLSDEPTIELVLKARSGDRTAVEALLQRCLPELRRWAHGRLPAYARESLDTGDLVQEAALHLLKRVDDFEPQHVGAMQAYLRQSVINRIRDEIRRVVRRPVAGPRPLSVARLAAAAGQGLHLPSTGCWTCACSLPQVYDVCPDDDGGEKGVAEIGRAVFEPL